MSSTRGILRLTPRLIATVVATAVLLVSGVGVTMAATGTLSGAAKNTAAVLQATLGTVSPTPVRESGSVLNGGSLPEGLDAFDLDWSAVQASGFVGVEISVTPGHVSFIAQAVKNGDGVLTVDVSINGQMVSTGSVPCTSTRVGQFCNSGVGWPLDADHFFCAPGGDTVTVHAYGFGIDETKSVSIAPAMENCPSPQPQPQPDPSTPEPSLIPEPQPSSSAPTSAPAPSSTP